MSVAQAEQQHISRHDAALMEAMHFNLDDLQTNRDGALSDRQRQYLMIDRQKNLVLGAGLLGLFILVTAVLLFMGFDNQNIILQGLGGVMVFCNMGLSWFFGLNWIRATYDLRTNETHTVEGQAQHVVRQFARAQAGSIRIGDAVEVPTDVDTFKVFEPGAVYRLYRTSHSGRILSIERIQRA